jgi:glyoxylase-like metal-dependent hydrolase (beta-lactamase superfamily II)
MGVILRFVLLIATMGVAGCASVLGSSPLPVQSGRPIPLSSTAFIIPAEHGEPSVENRARTGNVGFIVGPTGVLIVNAGVSAQHATEVMRQVRAVTDKPIKLLIITQAVQEFLMGAATFQAAGVPVLTTEESATLIKARCNNCLTNLKRLLGEPAMQATQVVVPDRVIAASTTIDDIGQAIELIVTGHGATPGDLLVFDRHAGVLFSGALVPVQRVPDLRDGQYAGWIRALDVAKALPVKQVAAGYGPPGSGQDIAALRDYLTQALAGVRRAFDDGTSLMEIGASVPLKSFTQWNRYPDLHAQNLHYLYLLVEREAFSAAPPPEKPEPGQTEPGVDPAAPAQPK